ncbi:MAG TPA: VOC family protein [Chloroflexota bacterium]|nr:VOC family protein [Chloroflexota bacterium]
MRLHHVFHTVPAARVGELRHFYSELLGLPEIAKSSALRDMDVVWFAVGDDHLHFGLDDSWDRGHPAHHIALWYEDVRPVLDRLRAAGLEVNELASFPDYRYRRLYTDDPFGRRVELVTPLEESL